MNAPVKPTRGCILLASHEASFLASAAEQLHVAGFDCLIAGDATTAREQLRSQPFDLLIADIEMPGNTQLELVEEMSRLHEGLTAILVTGRPSIESAIRSLRLPVDNYFIKPFEFADLLRQTAESVARNQRYRDLCASTARLLESSRRLDEIRENLRSSRERGDSRAAHALFGAAIETVLESITTLKHAAGWNAKSVFKTTGEERKINAPSDVQVLIDHIAEAVRVLEATKTAFKSKALGQLRRKLEALLVEVGGVD